MKKVISFILICVLLLLPCVALAEETPNETAAAASASPEATEQATPAPTEAPTRPPVEVQADPPKGAPEFDSSVVPDTLATILVEASTGRILYQHNAGQQIFPASTTKLLTALVVLDNATDLEEKITVGNEVNEFSSASSLMHLKSGHSVTIKELLYGLMLPSGNDAAAALAVHYGDSISGFAKMMNEKAKELGMENSSFQNPHGLSILNQNNYSTAADMAKLAVAAHQNATLAEIMAAPSYDVTSTELNAENQTILNSNMLLRTPEAEAAYERYKDFRYEPATGMKTGMLQNVNGNAYYGCLVASAQKDGLDLITCTFGDVSERAIERWGVTISLFEHGFANFAWADMSQYLTPVKETKQLSGFAENDPQEGMLSVSGAADEAMPGMQLLYKPLAEELAQGSTKVEQKVEITAPLVAPITQGQQMGKVTYTLNGEELYSTQLVADRSVYAVGDEKKTKEEYALPAPVNEAPSLWWLWIVIPAGGVGGFVLIRIFVFGGFQSRPRFEIMRDKGAPHTRKSRGSYKGKPTTATRYKRSTYYYDSSSSARRPRKDYSDRTRRKL